MMRYLSFLCMCMVWLLSTAPCFLHDGCIGEEAACAQCRHDGGGDTDGCAGDCCSPFLHCNTCTGCVLPVAVVCQAAVDAVCTTGVVTDVPEYIPAYTASIWQPPKI